jgi:hypothetical protein
MTNELIRRIWSLGVTAGAVLCLAGLTPATADEAQKTEAERTAAAATHLEAFGTFRPAFTEEAIDFTKCLQYRDGKPSPADAWCVRRTFGLIPRNANWQHHVWEMPAVATPEGWDASAGAAARQTTIGFLVTLKQPVEIGTLSVSPADLEEPHGSLNGGELYYLAGDVAGTADPAKLDAWTRVAFAAPAQHLRFGTLPKGTLVKALYYQDVRKAGVAQLVYLNAYKLRLKDVTAEATGSCEPMAGVRDAAALPKGRGWSMDGEDNPPSDKAPVTYTLTWKQAQKLAGVFFYSNADQFRFLAGEKTIPFTADWDNMHAWEGWHYNYRWLSFPALETSTLRVEITAVDGKVPWITGLAAMTIIGD